MAKYDKQDLYPYEQEKKQHKLDVVATKIRLLLLESKMELKSTEMGRVYIENEYGMESDI